MLRSIWLFALLSLVPLPVLAQEGTVRYEVTTHREVELPPDMVHLADQFASVLTVERVLSFGGPAAVTRSVPATDRPERRSGPVFRRSAAETVTWVSDGERIEQTEFLGRTFLIRDASPQLEWRLTEETAEFLGYPCQKAVATRDSVTVEAWFTTQIPVSVGPEGYGGLPGLILVLRDGPRSFIAQEVALGTLPDDALAPPTRGRAVTREEYAQIVREKMDELGVEPGAGGVRIIRAN